MARAAVNFSKAEIALLQQRGQAPATSRTIPRGWVLVLPGRLLNPLNQKVWNRWKQSRWTETWKNKVGNALLEAGYRRNHTNPFHRKHVTLTAHVMKRFDSETDGLRAACKPIPDGLKDYGLINDDGDHSVHQFTYADQVINRKWQGVIVEVRTA